jgi:protein-S-isoprenylcysteine O-methyltransferase Ste14
MTRLPSTLVPAGLFIVTVLVWRWARDARLPMTLSLVIIVGAVLLVFPVVWLGRKTLDTRPTAGRAAWVTTFVHFALMSLFGAAIVRAVVTHRDWPGLILPVPPGVGLFLVIVTGAASLLSVGVLAWRGLGAPFAIALSLRLAADGLYAWTRNPMVLSTLACLLSMGIWFRSALFVVWVLALVTPALLVFVRVYEERELEIRFGAAYLEYRSRTPMLFPRRPGTGKADRAVERKEEEP